MNEQINNNGAEMVTRDRVAQGGKVSLPQCLVKALFNKITAVLFCLVIISSINDIFMAEPGESDSAMIILFSTMLIIAVVLRFTQQFIESFYKPDDRIAG